MSNSLQNDIDYMKSLAQAGHNGPLGNGAVLLWAGLVFGGAALAQYALLRDWLPQSAWLSGAIWLGAGIGFALFVALSILRSKGVPNATARASNFGWSAVGIGVFFLFVTLTAIGTRFDNPVQLAQIISPMILLLYGMGWWVSAAMSCQGWLKLVAFGCFVAAPLVGLLSGLPEQLLAYAACLLLLASLPGFILMRAEKA